MRARTARTWREGGRTRTNTYTPRGQLETSTDLGGNKWTNKYDQVSGALTNILSPTGESLFYTYDELDNRKAIRFPDGNWLTNWFDAANRLATNRLPSGVTVSYKYDFAGRIIDAMESPCSIVEVGRAPRVVGHHCHSVGQIVLKGVRFANG